MTQQDAQTQVGLVPGVFPVGGRRLVVYVVYDRRGDVDGYIPFALAGLREHASRILVVVNGSLTDEGRRALEPVADEVLVRDNVGFDIWAHKAALDHVGEGIAEFDEVVLTNDTWFGPVRPFGPVFERMDARAVHLWGMTDHAREVPNPFTGKGVLPYHLQSFWIAARRELFLSEAWARYWRELPAMPEYFDAVLGHEVVFTERFTSQGYTSGVAYPSADYPTDHPALFNPDLLLADGCPVVKRRPFFHYPPFLDRHAVIGRQNLQRIAGYGYPVDLILQNFARNVAPKVLNTDAGMLEILPDVDVTEDAPPPLRLVVVMHVGAGDRADDVLARLAVIPVPFDLVATTPAPRESASLRSAIDAAGLANLGSSEVRVVPSESGRDMSAFFVACRDVLESDRYELVLKVHTRVPSKRSHSGARYFRRHQLDNLLESTGYVANLLDLFRRESGLGVVFPPTIHIGYSTLGQGWGPYRDPAKALLHRLGIRVPLDGVSPLAPLGGMWLGRPAALRLLAEAGWDYPQFRHGSIGRQADLARVLERLIAYGAGERGFHCRTVLTMEHAAISRASLEYKLDQLASTTPGYPVDQIQFLQRAGWMGRGGFVAVSRMYMRLNHPDTMSRIDPVIRPVGRAARRSVSALKGLRRRLVGGVDPGGER